MGNGKEVAIKKYNAILKANRTMFISVAIASMVVGASIVGLIFLTQKIVFKTKVISKQSETLKSIEESANNIEALKTKVKELQSNEALISSRENDEDNALQTILDALPSNANAEALGASLSQKILNVSGITIDSLTTSEEDSSSSNSSSNSSSSNSGGSVVVEGGSGTGQTINAKSISFSFSVTATSEESGRSANQILMEILTKMEKSIRTLKVTNFSFEMNTANQISMTVSGQAFYLPEKPVSLTEESITSDNSQNKTSNSTSNSSSSTNSTGGTK
ncbi:MAG: hypothetical protein Q4A27_02200 [bacterium]|nr:hypothetical protein [bacterium]